MKIFLFTVALLVVVVQINAFKRFKEGATNKPYINLMNATCPVGIKGVNEAVEDNFILSDEFKPLRVNVSNYVKESVDTLNLYLTEGGNKIGVLHEADNLIFLDRQLRAKRFNDRLTDDGTKISDANEGLEASVARWFEENETRIESLTELSAQKIAYIVPAVGSTVNCPTTDTNCEAMKHMIHEIHHQMVLIFEKFKDHYKLTNHTVGVNYPAYVAMVNILDIFTDGPWLNTQDVLNEYSESRDEFFDNLNAITHYLDLAMEAPEEAIEYAHQKGKAGHSIIAQPGESVINDGTNQEVLAVDFEFDFSPDPDYEHDMEELLKRDLFIGTKENLPLFKNPETSNHKGHSTAHAGKQTRTDKITGQKDKKAAAKRDRADRASKAPGGKIVAPAHPAKAGGHVHAPAPGK